MPENNPVEFLKVLFDKTWRAASPQNCMKNIVSTPVNGRTIVIGAGKASAEMARVLELEWQKTSATKLSGIVLTRYGHGAATQNIEIIEADHPVPDDAGLNGTKKIIDLVSNLTKDDLVICLISGGGSALLTAPAQGVSFVEKQAINQQLLKSGAAISEMNCVRKHLSAVKGGQLARLAYPAMMTTLMISDVPGDDPSVIASGPTVGDFTTCQQAQEIIDRYDIKVSRGINTFLQGEVAETPAPETHWFKNVRNTVIAAPAMSLKAAEKYAMSAGLPVTNLGDDIEGEARIVAADHARLACHANPGLIISGGETTVTVNGSGRGGRNAEYSLALATALKGHSKIYAIACDTDGIDGVEDNAGAIITPTTLSRAARLGLSPQAFLDNNDAYGFFENLGDLVITGPTRTNVNDFRAILILP